MSAVGMIVLNILKLAIAKIAPVILHDIWAAIVAAWPSIKAEILKDIPTFPKK